MKALLLASAKRVVRLQASNGEFQTRLFYYYVLKMKGRRQEPGTVTHKILACSRIPLIKQPYRW
jgi:hypothetical protein